MLTIDIRFREEDLKNQPKGVVAALESEIRRKLGTRWPDLNVRVRKSTSTGMDISGASDDDKSAAKEMIEDIWGDNSWVPG